MAQRSGSDGTGLFGPIHIIEPVMKHTHTAILLHGRGSNGPEFAQELFEETLFSDGTSLAQKLPSWRWVFPSSREIWSETFQEKMPAWFEAYSLTDKTAKQDLQIPGIKESTSYIKTVIDKELETLGGVSEKLVLGGISQGGAIAMWTLLQRQTEKPLGAFFGTNTWLPFASSLEMYMTQSSATKMDEGVVFVTDMFGQQVFQKSLKSTPVFLGHGTDDAYVDIELGRHARDVLGKASYLIEWKEYTGAELEGHWIKAPEELEDLLQFILRELY
ncbi:acyl- thioesterase 1 [Fusarium longipes]|uniref:Acyl-thioesterase 1 n=1 Tax=Fusarium longipes TaxID=694270 RepID=A0A395SN57_9HYPO|nr:acyl- thioesterase 1 [Fusarium longipes]